MTSPLAPMLNLPEVLNLRMEHNPENPMYIFSKEEGDITSISFLEFGRASHRAARALCCTGEAPNPECVALLGWSDTILYQGVVMGLILRSIIPFPISPRNSPAAVASLLLKTSCHHIIVTRTIADDLLPQVQDELGQTHSDFKLTVEEMPTLDTLYPHLGEEKFDHDFMPYCHDQPYASLQRECIIFHSSGSTGFPKPTTHSYLSLLHWAQFPAGSELKYHEPPLKISTMGLPPFHTFGVNSQLILPLYHKLCVSVYPPSLSGSLAIPPTPENILSHTLRTRSNALLAIPSLLQVWESDPKTLAHLQTLQIVLYSGGFLPPRLGRRLTEAGVRLRPTYGGTEFGSPTHVRMRRGDEDDWAWMEFSERAKVRWIAQGDGTYECQFLTSDTHALPVENLPDIKGYATADLWVRHPSKEYLWKIVGRMDDVIVHSSGEKTAPAPMEDVIISHPDIKGAVVFGTRRSQPGVLIELATAEGSPDKKQVARWRNNIWPIIKEANEDAPAFSRIFKEMIIFCTPEKPLPRSAGKGNVVRTAALALYADEIDRLYKTGESMVNHDSVIPPQSWTESDVLQWLLVETQDICSSVSVVTTKDLFEQGFDSLSATILRRRIISAMQSSELATSHVPLDVVYSHAVLVDLSKFLMRLAFPASSESLEFQEIRDAQLIETMIEQYYQYTLSHSTGPLLQPNRNLSARAVVFLTGSTGNLGAAILAELLPSQEVDLIYVLNRPSSRKENSSARERLEKQFMRKKLDLTLLKSNKLVLLEGIAEEDQLGLEDAEYKQVLETINVVIHAAWRLDFNLTLASFESNIRGTRNLIKMAQSAEYALSLRFLFVSSISAASVPVLSNGARTTGYGKSKFVAEQILSRSGLPISCSIRIGQMCGDQRTGAWPTTEWFPMLVHASLKLGALPVCSMRISWVPVDVVAKLFLHIALDSKSGKSPQVISILHPRPIEWTTVIATVREKLRRIKGSHAFDDALELVSFESWVERLEGCQNLDLVPALKLLSFFRDLSKKSVQAEIDASFESGTTLPEIQSLDQITAGQVERWIEYWDDEGAL